MKRMLRNTILTLFPIIILWVFIMGFKCNFQYWHFDEFGKVVWNVHIDLRGTIERFTDLVFDNGLKTFKECIANLEKIDWTFNPVYTEITDMASFFQNVGAFFTAIAQESINFLIAVGGTIKALFSIFLWMLNLVFQIANFLFNPIIT